MFLKPRPALALAALSIALIFDHHVTQFIAGIGSGDGFEFLSSLLATFSYINLSFAILFGLVEPWVVRRALANQVKISIAKNELVIDGNRFSAEFSSDTDLVADLDALDKILTKAMREKLKDARIPLRTSALVTALSPENRSLTVLELEQLRALLDYHFIQPTLQEGAAVVVAA